MEEEKREMRNDVNPVLEKILRIGSSPGDDENERMFRSIFEYAPVGISLATPEGILLRVNREICSITGYTEQELPGKNFRDITHPDDIHAEDMIFNRVTHKELSSYNLEKRYIHKNGSIIWITLHVTVFCNSEGTPETMLAVIKDITDRKKAEKDLTESERKYYTLFDNAPTGLISIDTEGNILEVNERLVEILGSPSAEATKKFNIFTLDLLVSTGVSQAFKQCIRTGKPSEREHSYTSKWDKTSYLHYHIVPLTAADGTVRGAQANVEDITCRIEAEGALKASYRDLQRQQEETLVLAETLRKEIEDRKNIEDALRESQAELTARNRIAESFLVKPDTEVFQSIKTVLLEIFQCKDGFIGYIMEEHNLISLAMDMAQTNSIDQGSRISFKEAEWKVLWGQSLRDRNIRYRNSPIELPETHMPVRNAMVVPIVNDGVVIGIVVLANKTGPFTDRDKHLAASIVAYLSPLLHSRLSSRKEEILRTAMERDLREAKHFLEEGERLAGVGCWYFDIAARSFSGSDEFYTLIGKETDRGAISLSEISRAAKDAEWTRAWRSILHSVKSGGKFTFDFSLHRFNDNSLRTFNSLGEALIEKDGSVHTLIGVLQDITEKRMAEERMKKDLEDKKVLLREIHHRVKNNLQIISSLLGLQSTGISDPGVLNVFTESKNRIEAIALVHERLYETPDISRIDFRDYAGTLINDLSYAYGIGDRIESVLDAGDVLMEIDYAVPCGLILQELLSNVFKHAFPGGSGGRVTIRISRDEGEKRCLLEVADNGRGIPGGSINPDNLSSLGLRLVSVLSEQIGGTLSIDGNWGTVVSLDFPCPST